MKRSKWPYLLIITPLAILLALVLLQGPFVHCQGLWYPDYPQVDLAPILSKPALTDDDYHTLYLQTGMARPAVDALRERGEAGRLYDAQAAFFAPVELKCTQLFGDITKEDHLTLDGEDFLTPAFADLQLGDILVTTSTHTFGWRHGHAGIVVEAGEQPVTLEAALVGSNSCTLYARHWQLYSNVRVLRLKNATAEERAAIAAYALETLNDKPYHLSSGFIGGKAPPVDAPYFGVQCDYLVWYAYQHFGYDIDANGSPLVVTDDIIASPLLEVVQSYGVDTTE